MESPNPEVDPLETLPVWWHEKAGRIIRRSAPPAVLYHYTDFQGLKGILSSNQLWATYCMVLNDGSEYRFGTEVVQRILGVKAVIPGSLSPPFVTCFCETPDLLSMWRSYAGHGGGYCIEFDSGRHGLTLKGSTLVKVRYGPDAPGVYADLIADIQEILRDQNPKAVALLKKHGDTDKAMEDPEFRSVVNEIMAANGLASYMAMGFKHRAFEHEREWRSLVFRPAIELMEFREGKSNIKPYVKLHFEQDGIPAALPISKVCYGPTLRADDGLKTSLLWLLERYGYKNVSVEGVDIPYQL